MCPIREDTARKYAEDVTGVDAAPDKWEGDDRAVPARATGQAGGSGVPMNKVTPCQSKAKTRSLKPCSIFTALSSREFGFLPLRVRIT